MVGWYHHHQYQRQHHHHCQHHDSYHAGAKACRRWWLERAGHHHGSEAGVRHRWDQREDGTRLWEDERPCDHPGWEDWLSDFLDVFLGGPRIACLSPSTRTQSKREGGAKQVQIKRLWIREIKMFCISLPRGLWLDMMGDTTLHVGLPSLLGFSSEPRFLFSKETQNRNLLLSLLQGASDPLPNNRPNPLRSFHCDE